MLSVPLDLQQRSFDDEEEYVPSSSLIRDVRLQPDPASVEEAAGLIAAAKRPVIVVGRGAMRAEAGPAITQLAERVGALLATTLMAKNWLRQVEYHAGIAGLYATRTAIGLYAEADLVIGVGASLNKFTTEHGYLFPQAKYIHIDVRPSATMGGGMVADTYIQGDARLAVEALIRVLQARQVSGVGYHMPDVKDRLALALDDADVFDVEPGLIDPRLACLLLDDVMPSEVGLILDAGQQVCFGALLFTKERSITMANQQFGCIGQGVITGIGASLSRGRQPMFVMEGDAGLMMHLAEFETAVRLDAPLLVVVLNDQCLGAEYHKSVAKGLNGDLVCIPTPDLGQVGVALGGRGRQIRTIDELRDATEEFLATPAPTILDVRISRQVLSVQYRRLLYGRDV